MHEAWLHTKEFIDSCKEDVKYRISDTFLAPLYTSDLLLLTTTTGHVQHTMSQSENPELKVLQDAPDVSWVDTMALRATIAHHEVFCNEVPPPVTTLEQCKRPTTKPQVYLRWTLIRRETLQQTIRQTPPTQLRAE